ncbi:MAG: DUF1848 domain-containing protein [Treponema sp.]|jgi:hypothetical protein|nr:DUF1848 domain-containing protein [Treponema sp.]
MIISASGRTGIPAYYSDWFFNRIKERYVYAQNSMNIHQISDININRMLLIVLSFGVKIQNKCLINFIS